MNILITGGTNGLGLAMARALAHDEHRVILTGRDTHRAAQVAATLPGDVHGIGMDVRDTTSIASGREQVLNLLGGLDVLINNAGIGMRTVNPHFLSDPQPFWKVPKTGSATCWRPTSPATSSWPRRSYPTCSPCPTVAS